MTLTLRHSAPIGIVTVGTNRGGQRTEAVPVDVAKFVAWLIVTRWAQFAVTVLWVAFIEDAIKLSWRLSDNCQVAVRLAGEWWQVAIEWMAEDVKLW